jgi:hypothetical protein
MRNKGVLFVSWSEIWGGGGGFPRVACVVNTRSTNAGRTLCNWLATGLQLYK